MRGRPASVTQTATKWDETVTWVKNHAAHFLWEWSSYHGKSEKKKIREKTCFKWSKFKVNRRVGREKLSTMLKKTDIGQLASLWLSLPLLLCILSNSRTYELTKKKNEEKKCRVKRENETVECFFVKWIQVRITEMLPIWRHLPLKRLRQAESLGEWENVSSSSSSYSSSSPCFLLQVDAHLQLVKSHWGRADGSRKWRRRRPRGREKRWVK